jgi:Uncharacterized conserved protein
MLYVGIGIVVVIGLWAIGAYNTLIKLKNKVKANWSQIDVVLKRRADLIPNLVETVKGYAKHESETLEATVAARNKYMNATDPEGQMQAAGELTQALGRIMMLSESYPELKADTSFLQLQAELKETENKIQHARQFYNDAVYGYTNKIEMFPSSMIANMFRFEKFEMFKAEEQDKIVPKVEF